jgi:hypothetical protein
MRPAVAERHAEALRRADGDVGAERPRRREQHERQRIDAQADAPAGGMDFFDPLREIANPAAGVRELQVRAEHTRRVGSGCGIADDQGNAEPACPRPHHGDHLRMAGLVDEECLAGACRRALDEAHRFAGGGRLVEQLRSPPAVR